MESEYAWWNIPGGGREGDEEAVSNNSITHAMLQRIREALGY